MAAERGGEGARGDGRARGRVEKKGESVGKKGRGSGALYRREEAVRREEDEDGGMEAVRKMTTGRAVGRRIGSGNPMGG